MMLQQLMEDSLPSAQGRVIVVLEGGYNLQSISNSAVACLHVLTGTKHYERPVAELFVTPEGLIGEKVEMPTVEGLAAIEATMAGHQKWPSPLWARRGREKQSGGDSSGSGSGSGGGGGGSEKAVSNMSSPPASPPEQPSEPATAPEPSHDADGAGATTVTVTINGLLAGIEKITFSAAPSDTIRSVKLKWCELAGFEELEAREGTPGGEYHTRLVACGHPDRMRGLLDMKNPRMGIYVGASTDGSFGSEFPTKCGGKKVWSRKSSGGADPDKDELTLESCGYSVGSDCKLVWTPNQCSS